MDPVMNLSVKPCFVRLKDVGVENTVTLPKVKLTKEEKQHLHSTKKSKKPVENGSKRGKKSDGKFQTKISVFFSPSYKKKEIKEVGEEREEIKKEDIKEVGKEKEDRASPESGTGSRSVMPSHSTETSRANTPDKASEEDAQDVGEGLEADVQIRNANNLDLTQLKTELLSSPSIPDEFKQQSKNLLTEYRRFLALKVILGDTSPPLNLSPSAIVDSVWHLHLLMPAHYIKCCKQLGEEVIDHDTSTARDHEDIRKKRLEMTKRSYKMAFGEAPPDRFWAMTYQHFPERESTSQKGPSKESFHLQNGTDVNIRVLGQDGDTTVVKMRRTSKMAKLFNCLQKLKGIHEESYRLMYGGKRLHHSDTPNGLKMEDNVELEMYFIQSGC